MARARGGASRTLLLEVETVSEAVRDQIVVEGGFVRRLLMADGTVEMSSPNWQGCPTLTETDTASL